MENRGYRYHALKSGDEILQESTCPTAVSGANTGTAIGHQIAARLPSAPAFVVSAGLTPLVFGPIDLLSDGLAWIADYGRSRLGNGLLLFSKYPLDAQVDCLRYSEFTRWDEALAAKGALKARVDLPVVGWTDAYLTHLGATTYREKEKRFDADEVQAQREQLDELVAWIQKTRDSRNLILSGDFNQHWQAIENGTYQPAQSPGYATLVGKGPGRLDLIDSFRQVHPQSVADYTSDVTGNPYSDNPLDKSLSTQPSVVDDYIFVSRDSALRPQAAILVFNTPVAPETAAAYQLKRVPKRLSDHYGVLTTFALPRG
jgi:endonuclease/exonuclease/phosphatase family metal-dependent hydrolase